MPISLFGWLERIPFWRDLPYPTKSALLRAMKAALSVLVASALTAATAGALFPVSWSPFTIAIGTAVLQAVDKFLREHSDAVSVDTLLNDPTSVTDNPPSDVDIDVSPPSND